MTLYVTCSERTAAAGLLVPSICKETFLAKLPGTVILLHGHAISRQPARKTQRGEPWVRHRAVLYCMYASKIDRVMNLLCASAFAWAE